MAMVTPHITDLSSISSPGLSNELSSMDWTQNTAGQQHPKSVRDNKHRIHWRRVYAKTLRVSETHKVHLMSSCARGDPGGKKKKKSAQKAQQYSLVTSHLGQVFRWTYLS